MKLLEMTLASFGGLQEKKITLSDGINLLVGDNESGKSTLLLFIKFMFYGMPRKGHEDRERSVSRTDHRAAGSLTLSYEGECYRIERSFVESGRGGSERRVIYRLSDGAEVFRGKEPWEVFLKVPREVFESSVCIGQMKCELSEGKKGTDAIKNLLTTADEGTDLTKVTETLEKIRVSYRHKSGKGGKLSELSAQIHAERQALERAVGDCNRMAELEQRSELASRQFEETEQKLAQANRRLSYLGKIELLRRFDALKKKEEALPMLDAAIESCKQKQGISNVIPTEGDAVRLCALADGLEEAEETLRETEQERLAFADTADFDPALAEQGRRLESAGGFDSVFLQMQTLRRRYGSGVKLGISALVAAVVGIALGIIWDRLWSGVIGAAAALLLSGIAFWRAGAHHRLAKELAAQWGTSPAHLQEHLAACAAAYARSIAFQASLSERERAWSMAQRNLQKLRERLAEELAKHTAEEVAADGMAARQEAEQIRSFLARYGELQQRRAVLVHAIAEERHLLSSYDEEALRQDLADLGDLADGMDLAEAERQQKWIAEQRNQFKLRKDRADTERISLAATAKDPLVLADTLAGLEQVYQRAEEYCDALEMALEALHDASEQMSGSVTPELSRRAGEMMSFVSGGKYAEVRSGSDWIPSLADADGYQIHTDLLSGGTRDLAYLTLRLSLMLHLFGEEIPPLLMDESLCQLDDTRMGRVLTLLSHLCEGRFQCLLFSCQSRELRFCEEKKLPCTVLSW